LLEFRDGLVAELFTGREKSVGERKIKTKEGGTRTPIPFPGGGPGISPHMRFGACSTALNIRFRSVVANGKLSARILQLSLVPTA